LDIGGGEEGRWTSKEEEEGEGEVVGHRRRGMRRRKRAGRLLDVEGGGRGGS
jgi:hypothetical protein